MSDVYEEISGIRDQCALRGKKELEKLIPLLKRNGGGTRPNATLFAITLSTPVTQNDKFIIGLRYLKQDRTYTEDHFSCGPDLIRGKKITAHPKEKLEHLMQEYKGTHKGVPDLSPASLYGPFSEVNTVSYIIGS